MFFNLGINLINFCFIVWVKKLLLIVLIIFLVCDGEIVCLYKFFNKFIIDICNVVNIGIVVKGKGIVVVVVVIIVNDKM